MRDPARLLLFWSLDEVVGDLRIHVRASVRSYVHPSRCCSKTVHYFFSETLQLVRACKREKNVISAFLKKIPVLPILAKNCPKLAILLDAGFWQDAGIAGNPRKT